MLILAIDTSVGISVALHDGTSILAERTTSEHGIQGELAVSIISEVLSEARVTSADVTEVIVGVGPGPFTGLRVGIAIAQVFAAARHIPIRALCSLDAVAHRVPGECIVVTNARRKELYWAHYDSSGNRLVGPSVDFPTVIAETAKDVRIVGPAALLYSDVLTGEEVTLTAGALAELVVDGHASFVDVLPMYLRKPDAQEPTTRKSVLDAKE